MSQLIIDVGAAANDGQGDPIRTAFQKTNANFTELYQQQSGVATDVYYVSQDGNDTTNNGKSLSSAFATIKKAVEVANVITAADSSARVTIFLKTGNYVEDNPVVFGNRVTLWGDNLRSVNVSPLNNTLDIFQLTNGCYVAGVTFRGHLSPAAAVAFPSNGNSTNNVITTSPYVQNCSSITTTGCGMRIDGALAGGLMSMVTDSYTQINQGGLGVHILNEGYAQLVSVFTICCSTGVLVETGATCSITNSNTSFGTYGLVAKDAVQYNNGGLTDGVDQYGTQIALKGLTERPNINQAISFDNGVTMIDIWDATTPMVNGLCTVTLAHAPIEAIPDNTPVIFFIRSTITAASHTFEFVGTGTNLTTALPQTGAIDIPANQVKQLNYGQVIYTSTDQDGNFKVGSDLTINGATGTITGDTFDKSLFAVMTPYILALEG